MESVVAPWLRTRSSSQIAEEEDEKSLIQKQAMVVAPWCAFADFLVSYYIRMAWRVGGIRSFEALALVHAWWGGWLEKSLEGPGAILKDLEDNFHSCACVENEFEIIWLAIFEIEEFYSFIGLPWYSKLKTR